jgi:hypothetical protein
MYTTQIDKLDIFRIFSIFTSISVCFHASCTKRHLQIFTTHYDDSSRKMSFRRLSYVYINSSGQPTQDMPMPPSIYRFLHLHPSSTMHFTPPRTNPPCRSDNDPNNHHEFSAHLNLLLNPAITIPFNPPRLISPL